MVGTGAGKCISPPRKKSDSVNVYLKSVVDAVSPSEIVSLVQELVRIPSHIEVPDGERGVATFLDQFMRAHGLETQVVDVVDSRPNVYGAVRGDGSGPSVLFNGHTDTVPAFDMTIAPFDPVLKDGRVYGRGSTDMKGAIACMVSAMIALRRRDLPISGDVVFVGTVGEEPPSRNEGMRYFISHGHSPIGMAVIGEPTSLRLGVAHRGMGCISVEVHGKPAHAATPEQGRNAIICAAKAIAAIGVDIGHWPVTPNPVFPDVGHYSLNIGRVDGGRHVSIVPDFCKFSMDVRYPPKTSMDDVRERLESILNRCGQEDPSCPFTVIEESPSHRRIPMQTPPEHNAVRAAQWACEAAGIDPEPVGLSFWTEGSLLAEVGTPAVVIGPGRGAQAHAPVEYVSVDDLLTAYRMYVALLVATVVKHQ